MILATIDKAYRYADCHHRLSRGFEFLQTTKLDELPVGKHEIDGDRLFAIVARDQGRGRDAAILEAHRRYIDIQYVVSGNEVIGWHPLASCSAVKQAYNTDTDLAFFLDRPPTWFTLALGSFAVFFPEDAHAPLAGTDPVHKVVVKVAIN
jgi:YhcH/YjgK/YiaL family protein